ncbi:hypothetical protein AMTRI_Chr02g255600 [Amborella trichopoda]
MMSENERMDDEKAEFLKEFGRDYGYPEGSKSIDEIRALEFKRLNGLVYLDHTGATLYSELQMEAIFNDLKFNVYGNPHSQSDSSLAASERINSARQQVLDYFNASAKDYKCIFTSGATAALKLVGEAFPWSTESTYMYTMENHNSVLGIREYALNQGSKAVAVDIEQLNECGGQSDADVYATRKYFHPPQRRDPKLSKEMSNETLYNLFAFPSECNFSGIKFDLSLVKNVKEDTQSFFKGSPYGRGCWMVLIDAAKGCATEPPDLSKFPADFVVLSFYKIFGYPTGLGALLVRTEAAKLLKKAYFSGGTVAASIANIDFVSRRQGVEESFEDGTQSFLSIASIHHGFKLINDLRVSAISRHTAALTAYVRKTLLSLRHVNGTAVSVLYGSDAAKGLSSGQGPTISFNLKRPDGSWFGYREVEKLASLSMIQLRTGCFCNPGACSKYLGLSETDLRLNFEAGHVCWDDNDILHGKPTGAVRISFGYMSTFEDAKKFISFLVNSFVSKTTCGTKLKSSIEGTWKGHSEGEIYLKSITIYPIKSCAGFSVEKWPLSSTGLHYDREWLLRSINGEVLTQKKVPRMCSISTFIDSTKGKLFVESPNCPEPLQIALELNTVGSFTEEADVYGRRYQVQTYGSKVNQWFTDAVGRPCVLMRCHGAEFTSCIRENDIRGRCRDVNSRLNFVNEAQLLLISEASVRDLNTRINSRVQKGSFAHATESVYVDPMRFRPNFVVSGANSYDEDNWRSVNIGKQLFTALGGCNRCQMINISPWSGQVQMSKEPLATLASFRRVQGKILFGVLLRYETFPVVDKGEETEHTIQVGTRIYPERM